MKIIEKAERIKINGQTINYTLRLNPRARRLRLTIRSDGSLIVTQPRFLSSVLAKCFIEQKKDWLISKINHFRNLPQPVSVQTPQGRGDYLARKEEARTLIFERLEYFNRFYNFKYFRVSVRDQKTRWGSCSKKGNLNFSYRLIDLSERLRDYIIVHELCHLKELNHSLRFWALVARTLPDYQELRRQLKGRIF